MSLQVAHPFEPGSARKTFSTGLKLLVSAAIVVLAAVFVARYALHYYFQYNQAAFDKGITHY